jgi:hypothetical protein
MVVYTAAAKKEITKGIPSVCCEKQTVCFWDLTVQYSLAKPDSEDEITNEYGITLDVEALEKNPEEFTKDELLDLIDPVAFERWDDAFDSFYGSLTQPGPEPTSEVLQDFDFDSLT